MTANTKPQSAVALPATRPETYYPTYSEGDLKRLLQGLPADVYLTYTKWDSSITSEYTQPYPIKVNLPILKPAEIREALRTILMNKQAEFAKRYAEEQAKIFEELQKLVAIGYEEEATAVLNEAERQDEEKSPSTTEVPFDEDETSDYADDSGHCGDNIPDDPRYEGIPLATSEDE